MSNAVKHQQALKKRNRGTNPVPFASRILCTKAEAVKQGGPGRRKLDELIDEGRIKTTVIDGRIYIFVESFLEVINAGIGQRLPEPWQMSRAKTEVN